jgi:hypothetical protein
MCLRSLGMACMGAAEVAAALFVGCSPCSSRTKLPLVPSLLIVCLSAAHNSLLLLVVFY